MMGWTDMPWGYMNEMMDPSGGGWSWMWLLMIGFYALVILVVVLAVKATIHSARPPVGKDAETILEERFARGEIDREEFESRRDVLRAA